MSEVLSFLLGTSLQENPRNSNEPAKDFGNAFRASCCPFHSCELGIAQLMTKQTTITIETKSLLVLCSRSSRRAWCPVCGVEAEVIVVERGLLSSQEAPAFDQLLNSGEVHRADAPDGSILICLSSLLNRVQNTKPANCGIPRLPNNEKERP